MEHDTALTVDSATLRIVATFAPSRSAEQLERLRGEIRARSHFIPGAVSDELLDRALASVPDAHDYLVRTYQERWDLPGGESAAWLSLITEFAEASQVARQPSISEVTSFLGTITHCSLRAVDVARFVDGREYVDQDSPGAILVNRLTLASPLEVALDLAPVWGTPTAVAALFYFVRFAFGADLDIRAHRESKRAEYLEARIRATELEVRHREMLESMASDVSPPVAWDIERVEITDD